MTSEMVSEHGAPMSLNQYSMDEIWNSAYMRRIRRAMLKGDRIAACEVCYVSEAATGQSYRTTTGLQPFDGAPESAASMRKFGQEVGFRVDERPGFIKLEVSNLCNLKCRMCYGAASSQIERDPVHSRWSGGVEPMHAVWRGEHARIGPEPRIGVHTSGLTELDFADGGYRRWTDGHATIRVGLQPGTGLTELELRFHASGVSGQRFQIIVNGHALRQGILEPDTTELSVDLRGIAVGKQLSLEIISSTIVDPPGAARRGLALRDITLRRAAGDAPEQVNHPRPVFSRLTPDAPWYMDRSLLTDDILKPDGSLRRLYITGGEPLLNANVADILEHLVQSGAARQTHLQLSSNCTSIDRAMVENIRQFRRVEILVSLDAVGPAYEYIRYPARWPIVAANVRKLRDAGLTCWVTPVVNIYNVLELVPLYRYCDAEGMDLFLNILSQPNWLAIHNLPPTLRRAAAAKLRDYLDSGCRDANRAQVEQLAAYLHDLATPTDAAVLRDFMLFTNDLDVTRRQCFSAVHPEFVSLLAEDGFEWTEETRFAEERHNTISARERSYAWL